MDKQKKILPATRKALKALGFRRGTALYPWPSLEYKDSITVAAEAFEDYTTFLIRLEPNRMSREAVLKFKSLLKPGEARDIYSARGREAYGDAYVNQRRLVSLARKMKEFVL